MTKHKRILFSWLFAFVFFAAGIYFLYPLFVGLEIPLQAALLGGSIFATLSVLPILSFFRKKKNENGHLAIRSTAFSNVRVANLTRCTMERRTGTKSRRASRII